MLFENALSSALALKAGLGLHLGCVPARVCSSMSRLWRRDDFPQGLPGRELEGIPLQEVDLDLRGVIRTVSYSG